MRRAFMVLFSLAFLINTPCLLALDLSDKWSLGISGGMGFTLSPEIGTDYLPTSFVVSGDLTYMFAENFGFTPVNLSYHGLSFDMDKFAEDYGLNRRALDELDTSVWMLGFTPGIIFRSSPDSRTRVFGEFGAGFYHYKWEVGVPAFPEFTEQDDGYDFSALFGGGIEVDLSNSAAFSGQGRLNIFNTDAETIMIFDLMGGIKFHF